MQINQKTNFQKKKKAACKKKRRVNISKKKKKKRRMKGQIFNFFLNGNEGSNMK
jgi:hypothetical protein